MGPSDAFIDAGPCDLPPLNPNTLSFESTHIYGLLQYIMVFIKFYTWRLVSKEFCRYPLQDKKVKMLLGHKLLPATDALRQGPPGPSANRLQPRMLSDKHHQYEGDASFDKWQLPFNISTFRQNNILSLTHIFNYLFSTSILVSSF